MFFCCSFSGLNFSSWCGELSISHSSKLKTFFKKIMRKEEYKIKGVERKKFMRGGGRQNMNCKFKTFGILDTRHIVQLPYFIPPSNKTGRKKAKSFFMFYHFQFQILKV